MCLNFVDIFPILPFTLINTFVIIHHYSVECRFMILFSRVCLYSMRVSVCACVRVCVYVYMMCLRVVVSEFFFDIFTFIFFLPVFCVFIALPTTMCMLAICCLMEMLFRFTWIGEWVSGSERVSNNRKRYEYGRQAKQSQVKPLCCAQTNNFVEISCRK